MIPRHCCPGTSILVLQAPDRPDTRTDLGVETMQPDTIARSGTRKSARGFAVVLHEADFRELIFLCRAMQSLDYLAYLAGLWRRMSLLRQEGLRVLVGPFLIDQHISYADRVGAPPFSPVALRAFDCFVTQTCPHTREWRGEPIDRFISNLRAAEGTDAASRAPPLPRIAPSVHGADRPPVCEPLAPAVHPAAGSRSSGLRRVAGSSSRVGGLGRRQTGVRRAHCRPPVVARLPGKACVLRSARR